MQCNQTSASREHFNKWVVLRNQSSSARRLNYSVVVRFVDRSDIVLARTFSSSIFLFHGYGIEIHTEVTATESCAIVLMFIMY